MYSRFITILLLVGASFQGEAERKLLLKLFKNYQILERPVVDYLDALEVQFDLTLQQIIDVDEKYQVINSNIWLNLIWHDYRLVWDPSEYGNISVINMPIKEVWRPDILMFNSADEKFDATFPTNAVIESTGQVKWVPPGMFKSSCNINIRWFPFDDQQCELKFRSWTHDGNQVNLTLVNDSGDISAFIKNGEWTLLGMPARRYVRMYDREHEGVVPWIETTFTINIRRRALYYTFNLIIPSVLLSSIALLTFTLPPESGEKISLGVTIVLSMTVFLMLLADAMPPTSDAIPLIGVYFAANMMMCSLSVLFTVLVLNFYSRRPETHEMPDLVKRGVCVWLAWLLRMDRPGHDLTKRALVNWPKEMAKFDGLSSRSLLANVLDIDDDIRSLIGNFPKRVYFGSTTQRKARSETAYNCWEENESHYSAYSRKHLQVYAEARNELAAVLNELRTLTSKLREDEAKDDEASDWKFAATVIDRLCLYIFALSTAVSTSIILLSAPNIFA